GRRPTRNRARSRSPSSRSCRTTAGPKARRHHPSGKAGGRARLIVEPALAGRSPGRGLDDPRRRRRPGSSPRHDLGREGLPCARGGRRRGSGLNRRAGGAV
ncbi:MAG: hypothetical protein AVDCRST_MAG59-5138, partial [uncultured Thermomicrobiales bacterium]